MNPRRYIMPVIIAAGLHGALLLYSKDRVLPAPPVKNGPLKLPDFPPLEMTVESSEMPAGEERAASPARLPELPEAPREMKHADICFVPVKPTFTPIAPVTERPRIPEGGVGDPGDGTALRGGPRGIARVTTLDRAPRATVQSPPPYPGNMRSTDGSVTVEFVVDTSGRVVTAEALRWTHREFVDPAVRSVLRWRFEPGTIDGRKVNFRMVIPIVFVATN